MGSSIVRASTFIRAEAVSTLRQPRLLLILVLGPFLVLFLFGLGYAHDMPRLSTIVVGSEGELTDRVDEYVRNEEPGGIDYQGTTEDEEAALTALREGEVDLVVVLPDHPVDTLEQNERATIRIHQRTLDPITSSQIAVAAESAVSRINDAVLETVLADAQERSQTFQRDLEDARQQLDAIREAVDADDVAVAQARAGRLAEQLRRLADVIGSSAGIVGRIGLGDDVDEMTSQLRTSADQLEAFSSAEGLTRLDEAAETLDRADETLGQLRAVDPAVAVRPFEAQVVSETPVDVSLDRFYAPGLVALMIQHLGITFAALALMRERQTGTVDMFTVAPVSLGERIAGKTVAFLLLGGSAAAALTALIVAAFDVPLPVSWLAFVALVALTLLASIAVGFLVAGISENHSQTVQFAMLLLLTAIFFSGLFMPLERIGSGFQAISWLLPATYAFSGLQDLMLLQNPTDPRLFFGLAAIAAGAFALAGMLLPRGRSS